MYFGLEEAFRFIKEWLRNDSKPKRKPRKRNAKSKVTKKSR
jgi:hypothetical protein